ncbi:MAG TPA: hypothetical protein VLK84_01860 [Longimicrobium sp.]|nr:hypothetical protein [Longimicrobium sp.]
MRKLKLNPELLAVESFSTALTGHAHGTVRGALYAEPTMSEPQLTDQDYSICTAYTACAQSQCNSMQAKCATAPLIEA